MFRIKLVKHSEIVCESKKCVKYLVNQNCEFGNMDLQFVTSISELRMWVSRFVN